MCFFELVVRDHSKDPPGGRAYVGGTRSLRSVVHDFAGLHYGTSWGDGACSTEFREDVLRSRAQYPPKDNSPPGGMHLAKKHAGNTSDAPIRLTPGNTAETIRWSSSLERDAPFMPALIAASLCHLRLTSIPAADVPCATAAPGTQLFVGALILIAWPPLIVFLLSYAFVRYLSRARRGGTRSITVASAAVIALGLGQVFVTPDLALVVLLLAVTALIWLVSSRMRGARQTQDTPT